jgi:hypothetical protein
MARPGIRRIGRIAIVVVVVAALALPLVLVVAQPEVTTALFNVDCGCPFRWSS